MPLKQGTRFMLLQLEKSPWDTFETPENLVITCPAKWFMADVTHPNVAFRPEHPGVNIIVRLPNFNFQNHLKAEKLDDREVTKFWEVRLVGESESDAGIIAKRVSYETLGSTVTPTPGGRALRHRTAVKDKFLETDTPLILRSKVNVPVVEVLEKTNAPVKKSKATGPKDPTESDGSSESDIESGGIEETQDPKIIDELNKIAQFSKKLNSKQSSHDEPAEMESEDVGQLNKSFESMQFDYNADAVEEPDLLSAESLIGLTPRKAKLTAKLIEKEKIVNKYLMEKNELLVEKDEMQKELDKLRAEVNARGKSKKAKKSAGKDDDDDDELKETKKSGRHGKANDQAKVTAVPKFRGFNERRANPDHLQLTNGEYNLVPNVTLSRTEFNPMAYSHMTCGIFLAYVMKCLNRKYQLSEYSRTGRPCPVNQEGDARQGMPAMYLEAIEATTKRYYNATEGFIAYSIKNKLANLKR